MLIRRGRENEGTKFIWGLPVYADGIAGRPRGWVWGERVHWLIWDGPSNRPIIYTRLPEPPAWRPPTLTTDQPRCIGPRIPGP